MNSSYRSRSKGTVSARIMVVIAVGVVVLAAIALIPGEERVVRGLLLDQSSERLRELAANRRNGDSDEVMLPYLSAQLSNEQWGKVELFNTVLTMVSEARDPGVVFDSLKISKIPLAQKAAIAITLALKVDRTDGNVKTEEDARLSNSLQRFIEVTMPKSPEAVLSGVHAYRKAGKPEGAWHLMNGFVGSTELDDFPENFRCVYRDVAFEASHVEEGYVAALSLWQLAQNKGRPNDFVAGKLDVEFDQFLKAAQNAGEISQASSALEARLATSSIWQGDLSAAANGSAMKKGAFEKYGLQLAQLSEWNSDPNRAFDAYARLAMLGDVNARARCRALQPGLYRGEDLAAVLLNHEDALNLEETRELAALVGDAGRIVEAKRVYAGLMTALPDEETELQTTLGLLLDENGKRKEALALLRKAYKAVPNLRTGAALGRVMVSSGHFQDALDHYKAMAKHDRDSASAYFHVASALGDDAAAVVALEARMAKTESPIVPDFVELAEAYGAVGQPLQADGMFQKGLHTYPESRELLLRYVVMLGAVGRNQEAINLLLSRKKLSTDSAAIARLVDLKIEAEDYPRVLSWLGGVGAERRVALSNEGRALVADIYLQTGNEKLAHSIIEGLPDKSRYSWLKAYVHFVNGNYREAERLQAQHVAGAGRAQPDSWRQLGRIRRALGDERAARECFAMALSMLNKGLLVKTSAGVQESVSNNENGQ